ncbi:aminoglycoside 3'-phosphotransferase/choline kinase family protein [Bradyrhizobium sediminis]|uniref:Aminoglycoside 3'-phosphotransferase/choline kinase family protein n=1 Tax=Bradyrhizobium sediminis TaxID=2840469 RepID=A0A975RYD1_9BRAD|nr:aminoglycoside 3'-phosphotransferase/choline kinase family protein [Bradyrhizobium sediminis]
MARRRVAVVAGGARYCTQPRPSVHDTSAIHQCTNLVVGLDDRLILKIFPPLLRSQFVSERISLAQLHGRLSVPIPEIVLEGERDDWPYLVITRLPGIPGNESWPGLPEDAKMAAMRAIRRPHKKTAAIKVCTLNRQQMLFVCNAMHWREAIIARNSNIHP